LQIISLEKHNKYLQEEINVRYQEIIHKIAADNLRKAEKDADIKQTELKAEKTRQASKVAAAEIRQMRDKEKTVRRLRAQLRD